jgi:hypothetical protein
MYNETLLCHRRTQKVFHSNKIAAHRRISRLM